MAVNPSYRQTVNILTSSLQVRTFPLLPSSLLSPCQSLRPNPNKHLRPRLWLRATLLASRWHLCRSRPFTRCTFSSCTLCSCRLRVWQGILLDVSFNPLPSCFFLFLFFVFFFWLSVSLQLYTYSPIQAIITLSTPFTL